MKVVILLMLSALFLGCSTEGEIKLINATSHYVYVEFESNNYVIEGSEDIPEYLILPVDTGKRFLFWSGDDEKVEIALEGETFAMYDFGEEVSTTEMVVKPNEASIAYLNPTNACVKIINDSGQEISDFGYYMDGGNFSPIIT